MSLIEKTFEKCRWENRAAFVAYVTAGDPDFDTSLKIIKALIANKVDIIELGVPFSDPLADGEANQLAADRALSAGITPGKVLSLASMIRSEFPDFPLVLFTYMNPIAYSENTDFSDFCSKAVKSGINAILPLDLPPEEIDCEFNSGITYRKAMRQAGLPNVVLISPTTPDERIACLAGMADSFIYYVSREGVTGEGDSFNAEFADRIAAIKRVTDLPVVVGFGISTPDHVRSAAATGVDGIVVGSAIVNRIKKLAQGEGTIADIQEFVSSLTANTALT